MAERVAVFMSFHLSCACSGDPTGILLAIDYFAIRAYRGDFLLELCQSGTTFS